MHGVILINECFQVSCLFKPKIDKANRNRSCQGLLFGGLDKFFFLKKILRRVRTEQSQWEFWKSYGVPMLLVALASFVASSEMVALLLKKNWSNKKKTISNKLLLHTTRTDGFTWRLAPAWKRWRMVLTDEESYQNDLNMLPYRFTTNSLFY